MKWSSKPQHSVWASTLFMGTVVPHSLLVVHNNDDFDQKLHFWIHHSIRPVATNFQSSSSLIWRISDFLLVYPSPNDFLTPTLPLQPFVWSCARSLPSFLFLKDMTFRYRLSAVLSNFLRIHCSPSQDMLSFQLTTLWKPSFWLKILVCLSNRVITSSFCSSIVFFIARRILILFIWTYRIPSSNTFKLSVVQKICEGSISVALWLKQCDREEPVSVFPSNSFIKRLFFVHSVKYNLSEFWNQHSFWFMSI